MIHVVWLMVGQTGTVVGQIGRLPIAGLLVRDVERQLIRRDCLFMRILSGCAYPPAGQPGPHRTGSDMRRCGITARYAAWTSACSAPLRLWQDAG